MALRFRAQSRNEAVGPSDGKECRERRLCSYIVGIAKRLSSALLVHHEEVEFVDELSTVSRRDKCTTLAWILEEIQSFQFPFLHRGYRLEYPPHTSVYGRMSYHPHLSMTERQ